MSQPLRNYATSIDSKKVEAELGSSSYFNSAIFLSV